MNAVNLRAEKKAKRERWGGNIIAEEEEGK